MHFWFVTFDGEPFVTLLLHIRYVEYYHCELCDHFSDAGLLPHCECRLVCYFHNDPKQSFISLGFFSRQKGFIYVTNHLISCLESCVSSHLLRIYGGTRDKNMGFPSGGDDLKDNATQRYAGKPNVRHWFVYKLMQIFKKYI